MLLVQKYHSIDEIDPEFTSSIEILLQEDIPHYGILKARHEEAPETDVFSYFLFFGPTQNTPIGFAQLCLRQLPTEGLYPWWKQILFPWRKEHQQWKQLSWRIGSGSLGPCVFDAKFARTGREKVQDLMKEYAQRPDVQAHEVVAIKGLQDFQLSWPMPQVYGQECYVLEPLFKSVKSYEEYLATLNPEIQQQLKASWKKLHKDQGIKLGDYASLSEIKKKLPVDEKQYASWQKTGAHILTFENDDTVLGCLQMVSGKNGNLFFEPFPFEPQETAVVSDELYTQYAILKFFDIKEARKCHLLKFGSKFIFEEKEDLTFFLEQGFQAKTLNRSLYSKLPKLQRPV
jgi:hypothetical protein